MSNVLITEADRGRTINARCGDTITVRLEENATTGHKWQLENLDPSILALQGARFSPPCTAAAGAAGTHTFTFQANSPGSVTLEFKYLQPWEPTQIADRMIVQLHVLQNDD